MRSFCSLSARHALAAFSVALLCGTALTVSPQGSAFSSLGEEWDGDGTNQCGNTTAMTPLLTYRPCNVPFSYDSSITSRGWDAVVRGGAYNWCYHSDPYQANVSDFCWEDITYSSGTSGAYVSAYDLGYNANGSYTLGTDSNVATYTQYTPISHNYSISSADIAINTNPLVPWYVNANSTYAVPYNQLDLQTTVTHEMGHALGLTHPQQYDGGPTDPVMACAQNYGIYNHTSIDDVNGELWHYGGENPHWGSPQASSC